jgi:hypothetical protein
MSDKKIIHIDWDGPYDFDQVKAKTEQFHDFGIYQIYGHHAVYGADCLLYIGKAEFQTFGVRLSQDREWEDNYAVSDQKNISVYLGRLAGAFAPDDEEWSSQIDIVEKMLICTHSPARNASNIHSLNIAKCRDVHILNWGAHRSLLPEVSGLRYTDHFLKVNMPDYKTYGKHRSEEAVSNSAS